MLQVSTKHFLTVKGIVPLLTTVTDEIQNSIFGFDFLCVGATLKRGINVEHYFPKFLDLVITCRKNVSSLLPFHCARVSRSCCNEIQGERLSPTSC